VLGIHSALHARAATGAGRFVDVAMLDGQIAILENAIARYAVTGEAPGPLGARHPSITPFAAYATADGHMVVAAGNDMLFRVLCEALGLGALADDTRFATNDARCANAGALQALLETRLRERPTAHWLEVLGKAEVPCAPLQNVAEALSHPQVIARNMVIETAFEDGTPLVAAGNPVKMSGFQDPLVRPAAPALDGDRAAILAELGLE
jgi:CoA:oxalate CoA-transferase